MNPFLPALTRALVFSMAFALGGPRLWSEEIPLFDGSTLEGWEIREGEEAWWRVRDGMIEGGSLDERVPHNTFLTSTRSAENFELRFSVRMVDGEGFVNSGVQIRSMRVEESHEMIGYQVDVGSGYYGDLYDESRRNRALVKPADPAALAEVLEEWGWNHYRVLAEGRRIRTWINGVEVFDFTETEDGIPRDGVFGLQAHGGGRFLVQFKDLVLRELPPVPGAPTWAEPQPDGPRVPEAQRLGFHVPEGFEVELVASEEQGVEKPITVSWDRHGRMWTMTAVEYPVDANENEAMARALFERGGRDRVLVFDRPNEPGPLVPRVFADGLAIPLGLLPTADGVLVQYGTEIRRYLDSNGDGKADGHELVLEGFGIQDSHLFPHQFEHAPGGWVYLAQGAFNYSQVRRPGGLDFANGIESVRFDKCKLARFRPDGSMFEPLTGGPNNIWGLVTARNGEVYLQEANDMGYPVAEFLPGTHYPTPFVDKLRDDAPILPPSTPGVPMGGTGLSGLALAEDAGSPFASPDPDERWFYLANPITCRIQVVSMKKDASGHPVYRKERDFMLSDDPWFRPIAVHFGPDGCLYVVDWYNKIISHNEVPRTHPERDKSRGRIWRIRHAGQPAAGEVPHLDLAALADEDLLPLLGGANARISNAAWLEIGDRGASSLLPDLREMLRDGAGETAVRAAALWALEGLDALEAEDLLALAGDEDPALRHEALRAAGEAEMADEAFLALISRAADDPDHRVRAALANAVRQRSTADEAALALVARLGRAPLEGDSRAAYDREFERYLARWALATHPQGSRALVGRDDLSAESRLLAARALPDEEAAAAFLRLLPEIERPLIPAELSLLAARLEQPEVAATLRGLLAEPQRRISLLRAIAQLDARSAALPALSDAVAAAAADLLAADAEPEEQALVVSLARRFRLTELSDAVAAWAAEATRTPAELAEGLAALREIGAAGATAYEPYLEHDDEAVRRSALGGLVAVDDASVLPKVERLWPGLPATQRTIVIDGLSATPARAEALALAMAEGRLPGFDGAAVEKVSAALAQDHPALRRLLESQDGLLRAVIRLDGSPQGRVAAAISLDGPFTLETWIRLDPGIDNGDGLAGRKGGPCFNFHDARLRLYGGPSAGDRIVASRPLVADEWTHCAITRDESGRLTLYLDGEADPAEGPPFAEPLGILHLGETNAAPGSGATYDEFRVWDHARSAAEIARDFRTRLVDAGVPGLVRRLTGEQPGGALEGGAALVLATDFPDLRSPAEAAALEERYRHFREAAGRAGDLERGRAIAAASCLVCHQIHGEGLPIGPDLSGAGAMGLEALLRNLLDPSAQLESAYYRHDVRLTDGSLVSGFLAARDGASLTIRQIGADERVIPLENVASHQVSRRSLMPEGLLDAYDEEQLGDLFSYLLSLR